MTADVRRRIEAAPQRDRRWPRRQRLAIALAVVVAVVCRNARGAAGAHARSCARSGSAASASSSSTTAAARSRARTSRCSGRRCRSTRRAQDPRRPLLRFDADVSASPTRSALRARPAQGVVRLAWRRRAFGCSSASCRDMSGGARFVKIAGPARRARGADDRRSPGTLDHRRRRTASAWPAATSTSRSCACPATHCSSSTARRRSASKAISTASERVTPSTARVRSDSLDRGSIPRSSGVPRTGESVTRSRDGDHPSRGTTTSAGEGSRRAARLELSSGGRARRPCDCAR